MPPSRWLSARTTTARYLRLTTSISAQNTIDRMASTPAASAAWPPVAWIASRNAYSGEVPMSP